MSNPNYHGVTPSNSTPVKGRMRLPKQGVDVPVSLVHDGIDYYVGRIANTVTNTSFYKNEGWVFEADRPTLPTEPGFYAPKFGFRESGSMLPDYTVFGLTSRGEWTRLRGGGVDGTRASILSTVKSLYADGNLVRVEIVRAD